MSQSQNIHLPPGILCQVTDPAPFAEFRCALCGDPDRPVAGVHIPDARCLELSLVYDNVECVVPAPTSALVVQTVHINPRPATFCEECYGQLKEASLARGGTPWEQVA